MMQTLDFQKRPQLFNETMLTYEFSEWWDKRKGNFFYVSEVEL